MMALFNLGGSLAPDSKIRQRIAQLRALHEQGEQLLESIRVMNKRIAEATNGNATSALPTEGNAGSTRSRLYSLDIYPRRPH